jgi:thioredoxin-like negative regulator of GroEL
MMISLIIALLYYYHGMSSVYAFSTAVVVGRIITTTNTNHRRSIVGVIPTSSSSTTTRKTNRLHAVVTVNNGVGGGEDDNSSNHHHINVNTEQQQQLTKVTKLVIPTITDENSATLLNSNPSSSTNNNNRRPVLVDAFAPWCGPCKLLDKVLRKVQPTYINSIDFCRWNVNDVNGTSQLRSQFIDAGYELTKLPSLIVYRDGVPMAVRPGFANEYQIQDFLELTLPDVLDRTFDEFGVKIITPSTSTTTTTSTSNTLTNDGAVAGVKEEEETCLEAKDVGREIVIVET